MPPFIWLQRLWLGIRDRYHQLKPCRFSVLVALIACPVFLCVAQGTEILRTIGEGMAIGELAYWPRVIGFFAALILWAVCSWYGARVLLSFDLPGSYKGPSSQWALTHVPRILGVAPILIVAFGFFVASRSYDKGTQTWQWLIGFAVFSAVLAVVFYLLLILRRKWLGSTPSRNVTGVGDFSWGTIAGLGLIALVSLALFVAFTIAPVPVAQFMGLGTILLLSASSWIALGSFFVFLGLRFQFPFLTCFFLLALLFSLWNDNHAIRELPRQEVKRVSALKAFQTWYDAVEKNHGAGTTHPLYIVATEGGGIRAAYWTAIVLGEIQDRNPNFAPHLFAISGVSGGSLGAAVFDALLSEPSSFKFNEKAHLILGQDFLSPTLASMLYPDLVQRFLPCPILSFDRGRSLEMGWEKAWRETMGNDRFAGSFVDLWKPGPREWMPALLLNGTSVEKGNRIITSNLRVTNNFLDAEDAAEKLAGYSLGATEAACHIPLSTAAHMSARFTFVSPAGHFPDGSRIVDGGYFENSAATTAYELATRIKDWCAFKKITNVDVKVIMISNDPRKQSLMIAPAKPGPEPPGPKRTKSETVTGHFMGEVTAPLFTLMNTRTARGTYAQKAIKVEQRRFKAVQPGVTAAPLEPDEAEPKSPDIFYFGLHDLKVPLPLGWMLSAAAAKTMQDQVRRNDDVVQNGEAMDGILQSLPGPTP
ncbi:MAG: hypothetical protein DLM73_10040 [Chthoniobacterales bacterium]|nr:MAG: hypothetical protein DLM73_10040 [Chthoniobacterales bacterium]